MSKSVEIEMDREIACLLMNRPEAFNALNMDMAEGMATHLISLATNEKVRGIVVTGRGRAFCAGGDLKWALAFPQGPPSAFHELAGRFHQAILEIRRMAKPVIAAINGVAAGGGFSLALACDFRVMSEAALLRQAYTSSGLSIDGGGTFTLPRLVGLAKALEIAAFDKPISPDQALSWGLVTKVVKDGAAMEEALKMAHELSKNSLNSFGWSKQILTDSFNSSFEAHIERERLGLSQCTIHPDGKEGLSAFVEKRKPTFIVT